MSTENNNFRFTAGEETPVHGHTELTEEQVEAVNEQLRAMVPYGLEGVVLGKALYVGNFSFEQALEVAGSH